MVTSLSHTKVLSAFVCEPTKILFVLKDIHRNERGGRKSSRRSLPMLLNNGLQQSTRSHVKNESSFGLTDDLDLYYIRQIASHMKVRSQNALCVLWSIHGSFQSCNMPCRPCTKKEEKKKPKPFNLCPHPFSANIPPLLVETLNKHFHWVLCPERV